MAPVKHLEKVLGSQTLDIQVHKLPLSCQTPIDIHLLNSLSQPWPGTVRERDPPKAINLWLEENDAS